MNVTFRRIELKKLHPLSISRGTTASTENLFVFVHDGPIAGVGELSPSTGSAWTAERGQEQLTEFVANGGLNGVSIQKVWSKMKRAGIDPPAMAALDVALWDLHAKKAGMPLYELFGLSRPTVPTSVTIGLNPAEVTRERVPQILSGSGAKCLKIKLGSPEGREFDKSHFEAAREAARPFNARLRVDANGGWTVEEAKMMLGWLSEREVDYVEQPLVEGAEDGLHELYKDRPLPIFIDESCRFSSSRSPCPRCTPH